jgi:acyl-CoA thioester hydrolase
MLLKDVFLRQYLRMKTNYSHSTSLRVRYGETDQMGYCYYGNYAQYCEVGRVEAMRALGMSYKELEQQGIMLPVSEFKISYQHPAKYDDELIITTAITEIKGARLFFDYSISTAEGKQIATAQTTLVFIKAGNFKPIPAPDFFSSLLQAYVSA